MTGQVVLYSEFRTRARQRDHARRTEAEAALRNAPENKHSALDEIVNFEPHETRALLALRDVAHQAGLIRDYKVPPLNEYACFSLQTETDHPQDLISVSKGNYQGKILYVCREIGYDPVIKDDFQEMRRYIVRRIQSLAGGAVPLHSYGSWCPPES